MPIDPRWKGLLALLSGTFAVALSLSFLFPATPLIMEDFGVSIEAAAWLSLVYALGATVFEPMFGRLGDLYGRRRNVLLGLSGFTVGAVLAGISPTFGVMLAARFMQGLGAAAVIPVGMAYVGENFPAEMRGRALGLWSMVSAAAPALGPTLGGYLIDVSGWRAIYYVSAVLGLAGLIVVATSVTESRGRRPEPFDYTGSALLFCGAGSLLTLLTYGRSWGWVSPTGITLAAIATISFYALILVEGRAPHPLINLKFVRDRRFIIPGMVVFISFLIFQGSFFMIPFFLEQVQGYSAGAVGRMAVPLFLMLALASLLAGRFSDRFRAGRIAQAGMVITALSLYLFSRLEVSSPYWYVLIVLGLLGLGVGVTLPPLSRSVIGIVEPRQMGVVSGLFNMFRNFGGPFGVAIAATLFGHQATVRAREVMLVKLQETGQGMANPATAAYLKHLARIYGMAHALSDVAWVLVGIALVGIMVALLLPAFTPVLRGQR